LLSQQKFKEKSMQGLFTYKTGNAVIIDFAILRFSPVFGQFDLQTEAAILVKLNLTQYTTLLMSSEKYILYNLTMQ